VTPFYNCSPRESMPSARFVFPPLASGVAGNSPFCHRS